MEAAEKLRRLIYCEFLLEPGLLAEVGLEHVPARFASLLQCAEQEAVGRLVSSPFLLPLTLDTLQELLAIRDMALVSCTAAAVAAELKDPAVSYERCCRTALCHAVIGHHGHVFSALRAAAGKDDAWARHHYLYGLILGQTGDPERGMWELNMALQAEPYEEGRARIRLALEVLEGKR